MNAAYEEQVRHIKAIESSCEILDARLDDVKAEIDKHPVGSDEEITLSVEYRSLFATQIEMLSKLIVAHEEAIRLANLFSRPTKRINGLLSRPLGPLPSGMEAIQPSKEAMKQVKSYRGLALLTFVAAIALLVGITIAVPWLRVSPLSALLTLTAHWDGWFVSAVVTVAGAITVAALFSDTPKSPKEGSFLDRLAVIEEQWFRSGSETWSWRQKVYSCFAFGVVHLGNFVYPLSSVIVIALVGGIFMAVYLRVYKKTGNATIATLSATKLHATYNRFAILYLIAAVTLVLVLQ